MVLLGCLICTFIPKASPLGDVTDWSLVPSGRTVSIENVIIGYYHCNRRSVLDQQAHWFPLVTGFLTDGLSVLLGTLSLTTSYSS